MEKDKKNEVKIQSKNTQFSLEFSNNPIVNQKANQPGIESSRIISLSDYKSSDKGQTDYSNLVLKLTKSF
ncbi:hypothetical protein QLS31_13170 [Flavobacterium sp. XS2P24]|uniref:hypothetical protein n=1 Tax=Flavobacterium sp. XS2P24 TaxID=3041249 RepID=UPI0024A897B5|nr:hypothetical protein [Flavobacterium sp. XS2P24]MDI6050780.1 hypothetical protein [Flavobacterium sp. XS2P24]